MSMTRHAVLLSNLAIFTGCMCDLRAGTPVPVTLETLLGEMTDRDELVRWVMPYQKTGRFDLRRFFA